MYEYIKIIVYIKFILKIINKWYLFGKNTIPTIHTNVIHFLQVKRGVKSFLIKTQYTETFKERTIKL